MPEEMRVKIHNILKFKDVYCANGVAGERRRADGRVRLIGIGEHMAEKCWVGATTLATADAQRCSGLGDGVARRGKCAAPTVQK